jgi:hypothetical protein
MTLRHTLALLALLAVLSMASVSDAALRTFDITYGGNQGGRSLSPLGEKTFSYVDGAFSDDIVSGAELQSGFSINHSSFPGVNFTLYKIELHPTTRYRFSFLAPDGLSELRVNFNDSEFIQPTGTDLPNGDDVAAYTSYHLLPSGAENTAYVLNNPSITIGTAAVPEPSAFGFGALALAVTGAGRWVRRRYFAG